ncbi:hypothetical protein OSB04_017987 [Centaurea solstitialis]|uniref:Protein JASON n=1 Tax=Centaurea solstitialis TaxID=347529 RepID=A0AA38WA05_9ASTR|nr:hypothetical protein OSB04_017987 [Centaurea solstitialis]
MSYLFGCFRFRDDDDFRPQINLVSQPITAIRKEPVDSLASNGVWSVLIPEAEDSYHSQCEEGKYGVVGSPFPDDELRAEAKFLKACGTLPQTPAEFRNSEKLKDSQPHNGDAEFTFRSWLSNTDYTSIENLLANPPDELQSPMKLFEEWENGSDSSSHSRESHMTGEYTDTICTSSSEVYGVGHAVKDTPAPALNPSTSCTPMVPSTQWKNKSVRFEGQNDACSTSSSSSSPKTTNQNFKPSELPFDQSVPKPSPYPTPLKLTDDMQTPGTVFPSYVYNKETGKNPRIRLQYAYSGVNHENISKLKAPIESKLSSVQCSALGEESDEQFDEENPQSQVELQANASEKEVNADDTLSSWLPPPKLSYEGRKDQSLVPISEGLHDFGRTPGERPILGVAAAHWNAENTPFSPKWWDGNGIPNTTTKYKEDQKVSWHATPFEERLEKALSEDKFVNERKQVVQTLPVEF